MEHNPLLEQDAQQIKELTVLYVEDESLTRRSFERIIRRRVKELYIANDGKEGIEVWREKRPDVIVTDIEMPVMNGLEMIRKIKEEDPSMPVIVLTAFEDEAHRSDLADYTLIKPAEKQVLVEHLMKVYEKKYGSKE